MKLIFNLLVVVLTLIFSSCKKNTDTPATPEKPKHVYVALDLDGRAAYTKNDTTVFISTARSTVAGIFVKDGDVYAAGLLIQGLGSKAVYWKNGVETIITDNGFGPGFIPSDIVVNSAGEVIVAGITNISTVGSAAYWKNGTYTIVGATGVSSRVEEMVLSGNDIYLCGSERVPVSNRTKAMIWKNNTKLLEYTSTVGEAWASAIAISGTDIYAGGWDYNNTTNISKAVYWKNGILNNVSDGTRDEYCDGGIAVLGTDVYLLSNEYISTPTGSNTLTRYYKNGIPVLLTTGTNKTEGTSLALYNNRVYVGAAAITSAGSKDPAIWKDGVYNVYPTTMRGWVKRIRVF